jgi:hypothetical protein
MYTISGDIARWNTYTTRSGREYRFEIWTDDNASNPLDDDLCPYVAEASVRGSSYRHDGRTPSGRDCSIDTYDLTRIARSDNPEELFRRYVGITMRGVVALMFIDGNVYAWFPGSVIESEFGGNADHAQAYLESVLESYRAWYDGETYGVSFDDDRAYTCGGFIGYDHEESGLMEYVRDECASMAANDDAMDAEVASMIEAELGTAYA